MMLIRFSVSVTLFSFFSLAQTFAPMEHLRIFYIYAMKKLRKNFLKKVKVTNLIIVLKSMWIYLFENKLSMYVQKKRKSRYIFSNLNSPYHSTTS